MDKIQFLPVTMLEHHPKNPRMDLGDLSELTESIRQKGVLQNLTVVPSDEKGKYWVLIGNRRFEAAKEAGYSPLPCYIAEDLTEREQVEIMLLENMQRTDLTIYEQAEGFQMMLDLGGTKRDIAEKTGFSKATVDKRLKLLNLDKEEFKAAAERATTLEDFVKIAAIEDEKKRNEVLKTAGTKDFDYTLTKIKREIEQAKWLEKVEAEVSKWATKIEESGPEYRYLDNFSYYWQEKDIEKPYYDGELFYIASGTSVTVYCLREEDDEEEEEDPQQKVREENYEALNRIWETIQECRDEYIDSLTDSQWKEHMPDIARAIVKCDTYIDMEELVDRLLEFDLYEPEDRDMEIQHYSHDAAKEPFKTTGKLLFWMILDPGTKYSPISRWGDELYELGERDMGAFVFLKLLGYKPSEVEAQIMDGTHPLYNWKEEK